MAVAAFLLFGIIHLLFVTRRARIMSRVKIIRCEFACFRTCVAHRALRYARFIDVLLMRECNRARMVIKHWYRSATRVQRRLARQENDTKPDCKSDNEN
jgi:hypothetical protein